MKIHWAEKRKGKHSRRLGERDEEWEEGEATSRELAQTLHWKPK